MGRNSGGGGGKGGGGGHTYSQADLDNRSRQLDPENDAYWQSRGFDGRPDDEDEIFEEFGYSGCCD